MNKVRLKYTFIVVIFFLLSKTFIAQTYFWNNFPTTTNSTVNWTPAPNNGGGTNQNNMSVNVVSSNGSRYYSYGTTSQYGGSICGNATNGLLLEMAGGNWSNKITVTITFTTPVCGPISFNIQDINEDRYSGDNSSYFMDRVSIGALNGVSTAIAPANITVGGCTPTSAISGNNRVVTAISNNCQCNTTSISINDAGAKIKQITLVYDNATPVAKYNPAVCQWQYVIITSLTGGSLPPTANITAPAPACGTASTTLTSTTSASSPIYSWSGPGTITSPSAASTAVNGAGVYTLTINPASSCSVTTQYTVTAASGAPTVSIVPSSSVICSGQTSTLTASGATTYSWSANAGSATTSAVNVNPGTTTIYTVTGTTSGCSATQTISITANTTPTLTISGSTSICNGQSTILTGATAANYTWSANAGSVTTNTVSVTPSIGVSTYTLTGSNGTCTASAIQTVTVTGTPTLSVNSPTFCVGNTATLIATGATSYTWSPATGLSATTGSAVTASPANTSTYTLTGTTAGCTATKTLTVTVNPLPTLTLTASSLTVCAGSTTTLTATGASTYSWSPAGSLSSATGSPVTATVIANTNYTVNATDGNGCKNTNSITINVNPLPTLTLTASSATICTGNSSTLTATGANTYSWSPAGSLSSATGSPVTATPTSTTTYTVNATNNNGCTTTNTISVNVTTSPTLNINPSATFTICLGANAVMNVSGCATYTWTPAGSLSSTSSATVTATPTTTTIYTVNGSLGSCTATPATATVTVNLPPDVSITATPTTVCMGASTTLTAVGVAASYSWSPTATLNSSSGISVIASPTVTTQYILTGTNANGCSKKDSITITVNATPTISISTGGGSSSQTVCTGATVNAVTFNASPNTNINWSNTNTNIGLASTGTANISSYTAPAVTSQQTGVLTAIATNSITGCSSSATTPPSFTITINPLPIIAATYSLTPGGCGGIANGCISHVAGVAPGTYQYSWNNGATWSANSQNCNIPAGNYTVEVKDTNGCIAQETILLPTATSPALPSVTGLPITTCAGDTIHLAIATTQPHMTYTWTSAAGTQSGTTYTINNVNPAGNYNVGLAIADSNGCVNGTTFTFTVNALPHPIISGSNHFCKGSSTVLNVTPTGTNYTYQWNLAGAAINGATATSYTATSGGSFGVTVINTVTGCKHDTLITITIDSIPLAPTVSTSTNNNSYCAGQSISPITVTGTGTFNWYTDAGLTTMIGTGSPFTPSVTTTSTVYVTATNSVCTSNPTPVVITINPIPPTPTITIGAGNTMYCENQIPGTITAGGQPTIIWYDNAALTHTVNIGSTYTPINLPLGTSTYYLIDSSAAGCKSIGSTTVSVTINQNPLIAGTVSIDSALCGKSNGNVLGLTASNGTPQYTYQWINASGTTVGTSADLNNVGAGTYSLIVIDANLCRDTSNGSGYTVGASNAVIAGFTPSTYQGSAPVIVTFSNTSVGAITNTWTFGGNGGTSTQINPAYNYTNTGTYIITLIAANGNCSDTAKRTITIDAPDVLIIPNIFSPNGDGINDQYFITATGISTLNCDIFNRWGQLIFTLKSVDQTWDGIMNNGNRATEGTYFYLLQASGYNGTEYKKQGDLMLVR